MRPNQIRKIGRLLLQSFQKQSGIAQFVLVGRVLDESDGLPIGGLLIRGIALEVQSLERLLVGEKQLVIERQACVQTMSQHNVAEFMSQNHGQRGFVRKDIEQSATDD